MSLIQRIKQSVSRGALCVGGALLLAGVGCQSSPPPPPGGVTGRIPTDVITDAELRSGQISLVSLTEFADGAAEQLIADLATLPEFQPGGQYADYMVSIIYGDIINESGNVRSGDLRAIRQGIRSRLNNSRFARNNIQFVTNRARRQRLQQQEFGSNQEDLLQEGRQTSIDQSQNPEYTLFLNGELYRMSRGSVHQYSLNFHLIRATDGVIIWDSLPYESKEYGR